MTFYFNHVSVWQLLWGIINVESDIHNIYRWLVVLINRFSRCVWAFNIIDIIIKYDKWLKSFGQSWVSLNVSFSYYLLKPFDQYKPFLVLVKVWALIIWWASGPFSSGIYTIYPSYVYKTNLLIYCNLLYIILCKCKAVNDLSNKLI